MAEVRKNRPPVADNPLARVATEDIAADKQDLVEVWKEALHAARTIGGADVTKARQPATLQAVAQSVSPVPRSNVEPGSSSALPRQGVARPQPAVSLPSATTRGQRAEGPRAPLVPAPSRPEPPKSKSVAAVRPARPPNVPSQRQRGHTPSLQSGGRAMVVVVGLLVALGGVGGAWAYTSLQAQAQLAEMAQIAGLELQLKDQARALEAQVTAYEATIQALNQQVAERNLQIANLTAQIDALEAGQPGELASLRAQLTLAQQERDSLQTEVDALEAEKTSLSTQIATLEAQLVSLEAENANLTSQVGPLEAQVTDLQAIVALQKRTVLVSAKTLVTSTGEAVLLHDFNVTNAGYVRVTGSATMALSVIRITTSADVGGTWTFTCIVEVSANCLAPALPGTVRIEWQPDVAYPVGQATLTAEWVY